MSIKSNNTLPEAISDTKINKKKTKRKKTKVMKRSSSDSTTVRKASGMSIELEMIISLNTGSEYHRITEIVENRNGLLDIPWYLDMIQKVKPALNMATLQHIPNERAVHDVLQYHDFK